MNAPNNNFAPFKTEGTHTFWIKGFKSPIEGKIEEIEFFENETGVEAFVNIVNEDINTRYRVELKSITAFAEEIPQAA